MRWTQWVTVPATRPGDWVQSLGPGRWKERAHSLTSSDRGTCVSTFIFIHKHTIIIQTQESQRYCCYTSAWLFVIVCHLRHFKLAYVALSSIVAFSLKRVYERCVHTHEGRKITLPAEPFHWPPLWHFLTKFVFVASPSSHFFPFSWLPYTCHPPQPFLFPLVVSCCPPHLSIPHHGLLSSCTGCSHTQPCLHTYI